MKLLAYIQETRGGCELGIPNKALMWSSISCLEVISYIVYLQLNCHASWILRTWQHYVLTVSKIRSDGKCALERITRERVS